VLTSRYTPGGSNKWAKRGQQCRGAYPQLPASTGTASRSNFSTHPRQCTYAVRASTTNPKPSVSTATN